MYIIYLPSFKIENTIPSLSRVPAPDRPHKTTTVVNRAESRVVCPQGPQLPFPGEINTWCLYRVSNCLLPIKL